MNQDGFRFFPRRRVKVVPSREIASGVLPAETSLPIEEPPAGVPVQGVRPGRSRQSGTVRRARLGRLLIVLAIAALLLATACVALGDKRLAMVTALAAGVAGAGSITACWSRRVSPRLLGYSVAVGVVTAVVGAGIWAMPTGWFEDPDPDRPPHSEAPAKGRRANGSVSFSPPSALDCSGRLA